MPTLFGSLSGRVPRLLHAAAALGYANALWLICCLPIVTAPAATCALWAAIRAWDTNQEVPAAREFLAELRRSFRRSLLAAAMLAGLAAVLYVDLYAIGMMGAMRRPMFVASLSVTLIVLLLTVFIVPALVSGLPTAEAFSASARAALRRPSAAVLAVGVGAVALMLAWVAPVTLLITGSTAMYALHRLWSWAGEETGEQDDLPRYEEDE